MVVLQTCHFGATATPMELGLPAWALGALFAVGGVAGFVNVVAGGGSLLTMPLLIFLGLPEGVANGTTRVAILVQNTTAVLRYRRAGRLDLGAAARLCVPGLLGALCGAMAAVAIGDDGFRHVLGWVMLGCALLVVVNPAFGKGDPPADGQAARDGTGLDSVSALRVWGVMLLVGFYGGLVQAGVGYLILFGLTFLLRMPLLQANIMKVVIVLCYTPIALGIFIWQDMVAWVPGLCLAAGQALGAGLGTAAALRRGAGLIRAMLAVVVILSAAHLVGLF